MIQLNDSIFPISTEISASYSGKINIGDFSNRDPFFSITETYNDSCSTEFIVQRHKELHRLCYTRFKEHEYFLKQPPSEFEPLPHNCRVYVYNNIKYPSVTTIIGDDEKFFISDDHLRQLGARGTIIHKQCEIYMKDGVWKMPHDIPEMSKELDIVQNGSSKLSLDGFNFPAYRKKYPFILINTEQKVKNDEFVYAGTYDFKCMINGVVTLCDIKTGKPLKENTFKQLAAYAKCPTNEDVKQLCIIYLSDKTRQGFSAPVIETDIDKYFNLFKINRETFRNKYGI